MKYIICTAALLVSFACLSANQAQAETWGMIRYWDNPNGGHMLGFDPITRHVFMGVTSSPAAGLTVKDFTHYGSLSATYTGMGILGGDEGDLSANYETGGDLWIGTNQIAYGDMLVWDGERGKVYAVNTSSSATPMQYASIALSGASKNEVGGDWNTVTNTFFTVDFQTELVREWDLSTGTQVNSFSINNPSTAGGMGAFDLYWGDIAVDPTTGNLWIGGNRYPNKGALTNVLRVLAPDGTWIKDVDLAPYAIAGGVEELQGSAPPAQYDSVASLGQISGLAIEDTGGTLGPELWVLNNNGRIFHFGQIPDTFPIPEPSSLALCAIGLCGLAMYRRRQKKA